MLLHGEEIASIERELRMEFSDLVNQLGNLAWVTLFNQFVPALQNKQPEFLQPNQYVRFNISGMAHIQTAFLPNFANPDPAHFPDFKFTFARPDQQVPQGAAASAQVQAGSKPE